MSSEEINSFLSQVEVKTDWEPSLELMKTVFAATTKSLLGENERWYRREESNTFTALMVPNVLTWYWNISPNKETFFNRLFELYSHRSYGGPFEKGIPQTLKDEIRSIFSAAWDILPSESESQDVQTLRIRISETIPEKKIDYTERLLQSSISGNKSLFEFWSRNGREYSTDPAFYSMVWAKIERSKGYTDQRSSLIHSAQKCKRFPEQIIVDLTSGGHNKNKGDVITVAVGKIEELKRRVANNKALEEHLSPDISYWQSILAKFTSCDDYYLIQKMMPHMRREDLIFLAPAAATAGLGSLIEKYMNPEAYPDFHRSKSYRY